MPLWADLHKLFTFAFEDDPISKQNPSNTGGAGVSQPDAIPDVRQDGTYWGGGRGMVRLRDTNEFIDLSSVANRQSRYKEYERLRNVSEVERAMTVFADEACLAGETKVVTVCDGVRSIKWLATNKKEDFLVYCWDFAKGDYSLAWAYDPRPVGVKKTIRLRLDDGTCFRVTPDHRILMRDGQWKAAAAIRLGEELMPFYRVRPDPYMTRCEWNQFPRIFTFSEGWVHERQLIDEWRLGTVDKVSQAINRICRAVAGGVPLRKVRYVLNMTQNSIKKNMDRSGFSVAELVWLGKKPDRRRVIGKGSDSNVLVYDLSVRDHENFCGESCVFHNCQRGEDDHVLSVKCKNDDVRKDLEYLFLHRAMLNMDSRIWSEFKNLCIFGDRFWEIMIDSESPKDGVVGFKTLPPDSIYRIETTKGKLVEFQQSKEGPDYEALTKTPIAQASEQEVLQSKALRFAPQQIVHVRIGDDRRTFYPYGQSLIEPARGPAHQLKLVEDAVLVYRLCLSPHERVRTTEGYKYIKDIRVGDTVYSYTQEGKEKETRVTYTAAHGSKPVMRVRSKHVEMVGTPDHPVLVLRDGTRQYVEIRHLRPKKDKLILVPHEADEVTPLPKTNGGSHARLSLKQRRQLGERVGKMSGSHRESPDVQAFLHSPTNTLPLQEAKDVCERYGLDAADLACGDRNCQDPHRLNLPDVVTEDFARLFGFLCGDGYVTGHQFGFAAGGDRNKNEKYRAKLEGYFGRVAFCRDNRKAAQGVGKFVVNSKFGGGLLKNMGYINDHDTNRIPKWVFRSPKNIRRAFVEGFSDADGCERHTKAGARFSTVELSNRRMVEDLKELWSGCGLCSGKVGTRHRKFGHVIDKTTSRRMEPSASHFVTISDLPLPEYENVWHVKDDGEQEVYDIEVEAEEHNFIANNCPVSNSRAPERRVFYIDTMNLPPYKAEAFIDRLKDQFRKKKVAVNKGSGTGASSVDERWHTPALDEDFWIPIRPNTNTRIETLPGASNLDQISDLSYFLNKLYAALNFPANYFNTEDAQATRIALSSQNVTFARLIERLQQSMEEALWQVADRHLYLKQYPPETYEDLVIKMTPPSHWKELSEAEVITNRINNANSLKGSMLMADFDILTKQLKIPDDEAEDYLVRLNIQKLQELKLQVLAQNPQLLGVGVPGDKEKEIGTEAGGPSPMLGPDGQPQPQPQPPGQPQLPGQESPGQEAQGQEAPSQAETLPDPTHDELKKYDLQIQTYSSEQDAEDIDYGEMG